MAGTSIDWENLPPKSKFMISDIRELGETLDKVGKGLDSFQKDTQSVNAKVEVLRKGKEERPKISSMHESGGSYGGDNLSESSGGRKRNSQSSMGEKCEGDVRMKRNRRLQVGEYVDRELMVDQIVSSFDLHSRKVVRLINLNFCGYTLEIRHDKRGPCEGWRDLKHLTRERFVPSSYI
ncbi:hypothetical protein CR513_03385, partial [Mucuna pruriens]